MNELTEYEKQVIRECAGEDTGLTGGAGMLSAAESLKNMGYLRVQIEDNGSLHVYRPTEKGLTAINSSIS